MNVTFTKEELNSFSNALCKWNEEAISHLLKELSSNRQIFEFGNPLVFLQKTLESFREKNPQPDWRKLL